MLTMAQSPSFRDIAGAPGHEPTCPLPAGVPVMVGPLVTVGPRVLVGVLLGAWVGAGVAVGTGVCVGGGALVGADVAVGFAVCEGGGVGLCVSPCVQATRDAASSQDTTRNVLLFRWVLMGWLFMPGWVIPPTSCGQGITNHHYKYIATPC